MNPLRAMIGPKIKVTLTRDSVCAGDDCDAPHEKKTRIKKSDNPVNLADAAAAGYLPTIAGVGHSWTCILNQQKIAKIMISETTSLVEEIDYLTDNEIHFQYHSADY